MNIIQFSKIFNTITKIWFSSHNSDDIECYKIVCTHIQSSQNVHFKIQMTNITSEIIATLARFSNDLSLFACFWVGWDGGWRLIGFIIKNNSKEYGQNIISQSSAVFSFVCFFCLIKFTKSIWQIYKFFIQFQSILKSCCEYCTWFRLICFESCAKCATLNVCM